jgi:hypothetical protein
MIDIENQIQRMDVNVQAYRQDLLARGLPPDRINSAANGEFVTEIIVRAPGEDVPKATEIVPTSATEGDPRRLPFSFGSNSSKSS